jgi:hypothetical protein
MLPGPIWHPSVVQINIATSDAPSFLSEVLHRVGDEGLNLSHADVATSLFCVTVPCIPYLAHAVTIAAEKYSSPTQEMAAQREKILQLASSQEAGAEKEVCEKFVMEVVRSENGACADAFELAMKDVECYSLLGDWFFPSVSGLSCSPVCMTLIADKIGCNKNSRGLVRGPSHFDVGYNTRRYHGRHR